MFLSGTTYNNLHADVLSGARVDLRWADGLAGETGFDVQRSLDGGTTWTALASTAANQTSHSANYLDPNKTYTFRVLAKDATGAATPHAGAVTVTTLGLAAPAELVAHVVSASQIDLAWLDRTPNESGFSVERSLDGGASWQEYTFTSPEVTGVSVTGLQPGRRYDFRVRARHAGGTYSSYSNAVAATTVPFGSPTALEAAVRSNTRVDLSWLDNTDKRGQLRSGTLGRRRADLAVLRDGRRQRDQLRGHRPAARQWLRVPGAGQASQRRVLELHRRGERDDARVQRPQRAGRDGARRDPGPPRLARQQRRREPLLPRALHRRRRDVGRPAGAARERDEPHGYGPDAGRQLRLPTAGAARQRRLLRLYRLGVRDHAGAGGPV